MMILDEFIKKNAVKIGCHACSICEGAGHILEVEQLTPGFTELSEDSVNKIKYMLEKHGWYCHFIRQSMTPGKHWYEIGPKLVPTVE